MKPPPGSRSGSDLKCPLVLLKPKSTTVQVGPISGKNYPELKIANVHVQYIHAHCIFSRILIGAFPFKGQLPRPKQKQGQKSCTAESQPVKSHRPKGRCEEHFGAASQLFWLASSSRPLQMGKRLAPSFLVPDPRAVLGFLARAKSSLFAPAS